MINWKQTSDKPAEANYLGNHIISYTEKKPLRFIHMIKTMN